MIETILAIPGWPMLFLAVLTAGLVYGFAGFGAALVFMPVGARILDPLLAVAAFQFSAVGSLFTVVPKAWPLANKRAAGTMIAASVLAAPLGIWILTIGDPTVLRWAVSLVVLTTLALLISGWRYSYSPGTTSWISVGASVGFLGGSVGLNGPAMILFQLAGKDPVAVSRANTLIVLTLSSLLLVPLFWLQGVLTREALHIGLALLPVYAFGGWLGRLMFKPEREGLYRRVAYIIIAVAGLMGLPLWS